MNGSGSPSSTWAKRPPALQEKLGGIFLGLLNQDTPPHVITLYGEGVKLACEGSPILDALQTLADKGARLVSCQSCLDQFDLRALGRVGIDSAMGDIVHAMNAADKVISVQIQPENHTEKSCDY